MLRAAPQIDDGFDAVFFERLGRACTHPPRDPTPAPPPKPSWRTIGIATGVPSIAAWLIWQYSDDPHFPMRPIVRLLVETLGHLK